MLVMELHNYLSLVGLGFIYTPAKLFGKKHTLKGNSQ